MAVSRELSIPRWFLPAELTDDSPRRRTVRDWLVDLAVFLAAIVIGWWELAQPEAEADLASSGLALVDVGIGFAACVALWWRRRIPLVLLWAMLPAQVAWSASGAVFVSVMTAALHRPWRPVVLAVSAHLAVVVPLLLVVDLGESPELMAVAAVLFYIVPMLWGMTMRGRRQLVVSFRREQAQKTDAARQSERRRIAREMHDTLAHRLSILSVHAGALAYRTGTDPHNLDSGEVHQATEIIQDSAQQALNELGEVLALLRSEDGDQDDVLDGDASLATRLSELADEARASGQRVDLAVDGEDHLASLRPRIQRSVFRVVQEGLTNARKHAPGTAVAVCVTADPGREVAVTLTNPAHPAPHRATGFGLGLTGLHERVAVDGGSLGHEREDGNFRLTARIPWTT